MNFNTRRFVGAFVVFSLAGLIMLVAANYRKEGGMRVTSPESRNIGVKMEGVRYSTNRDGRLEWELQAESAVRLKNEEVMRLTAVRLSFYPRDGRPYFLRSREGTLKEKTGEMTAAGDVRLTFEDGVVLETTRLGYSSRSREMTGTERARIISKGMEVTGTGLVMEPDKGRLRLLRDVKAIVRSPGV